MCGVYQCMTPDTKNIAMCLGVWCLVSDVRCLNSPTSVSVSCDPPILLPFVKQYTYSAIRQLMEQEGGVA